MYSFVKDSLNSKAYNIHCCGKTIIIDHDDETLQIFQKPPNSKNKKDIWKLEEKTNYLYTYDTNGIIIYLIPMLMKQKKYIGDYFVFIDSNPFNLLRSNIVIKNKYIDECESKIKSESYELVHFYAAQTGVYANIIKNPIWKIINKNEKPYLTMYCGDNIFQNFAEDELDELKKTPFLYSTILLNKKQESSAITNYRIKKEKRRVKKPVIKNIKIKDEIKTINVQLVVSLFEKYLINNNYDIIEKYDGHYNRFNNYTNIKWNVINSNGENLVIIFIKIIDFEKEEYLYTKIDVDYLEKISIIDNKNPSWFECNDYIACKKKDGSTLYLHHYIANYNDEHRQNILSVDHINQDKLDNRRSNLRIVNQSVQNTNRGKKNRMTNARSLPDDLVEYMKSIGHNNLPKFVTYNVDIVKSKNGDYQRDFFRIESKEILKQMNKSSWASSKSTKETIVNKYKQTLKVLESINTDDNTSIIVKNGELKEKINTNIPYTNMVFARGKHCMVFDKRTNGKRLNMQMTIKDSKPTEKELSAFMEKLSVKYPDLDM